MYLTYRKYGPVVEITEIEKTPSKIRVYAPRKGRSLYGVRRSDNIRRTRKICLRRLLPAIEKFGCPLLVTLTFAGDASDAAYANDSLRRFQVRLRNEFPKAESLFVPELSPRGRIHFHGLLFNVPLSLGDKSQNRRIISHGEEREKRILAKLWGEGFVDAKQTDGSRKLAYYISKYITKASDQILFNAMRILRTSHGFPKDTFINDQWIVGKLKTKYDAMKPDKVWSDQNIFLGKIIRKTYIKETT